MSEPAVFPASTLVALELASADVLRRRSATGKKLKIAIAIHSSRNEKTAVFRNTCERVDYLESLGHECALLTPDDFPWVQQAGARFIPLVFPVAVAIWLLRKPEINIALFHSYAGWVVTFARKYLHLFRKLHTAILFHGLEPIYYARLKAHSEASAHSLSWRYRLVSGWLMHRLLRSSTRKADVLMCLNSQEARFLLDNNWASCGRVTVLQNPVPESFFIRRCYRDRARQLLFVGQWLPMKGISFLGEAFSQLRNWYPDLRLCCAGTMTDEATVLSSFPDTDRAFVSVHPQVNHAELVELHRTADIFIFPTLSEGSSLALAEAMASGLPIVTTEVGAAPDVLVHEHSTLFVPASDSMKLSKAVEQLLDDEPKREKLGQNAQQAAELLRPQSVLHDFGVCFQLLASTGESGDNRAGFPTVAFVEK